MKTSWNDTQLIEALISGTVDTGSALVFEARLLTDPHLRDKMRWQKTTYNVIKSYGRRQLKAELEALHQKLFTAPEHAGFRQKILRLFQKK